MHVSIVRVNDNGNSTVGYLKVDGEFQVFTLEDTHNYPKVYGNTRIPEGTYSLTLRNEGTMTEHYATKFSEHRGMLWLRGVPGFKYVYIHVGNYDKDTDGCILVGTSCDSQGRQSVGNSVVAYKALYSKIIESLESGEKVTVEIKQG